jgi:hypothetical protein
MVQAIENGIIPSGRQLPGRIQSGHLSKSPKMRSSGVRLYVISRKK